MRIRMAPVLVAGLGLLLATGVSYAQVQPCTAEGCIQANVSSPEGTFTNGQELQTTVSFVQGADPLNDQAAIAFTLSLPSLLLADCANPDANGLTAAMSVPTAVSDSFRVVVENTVCTDTTKPCLCPGEGQQLANYANVVIFGPKELPAPGSGTVDFPLLPDGPLITFTLRVNNPSASSLTLHLFNETDNQSTTPKPQFGAFLSVGDTNAVDDTVNRETNTSNVKFTDGTVAVTPVSSCVGDCNGNGEVTIGELQIGLNIFFGTAPVSLCPSFDVNMSGEVTIGELQQGLNNFFDGCPQ